MPNALHSGRSASLPAGRSTRAPVQKSGGAGAAPRIDADGYFDGYASLFCVADLGRDVVMPGAFRASLAQRTAIGVKQLWQHDPRNPVGEWLEIAEDQRGLRVLGRLDLELPKARELHRLITRATFEERIDALMRDKRELAELTVGSGETWIGKLPEETLRELLALG